MYNIYLTIVLLPLAAAVVAGLFGARIGRAASHWLTILAVALHRRYRFTFSIN